jgi:TetR/AcrR family transcriptional regulator
MTLASASSPIDRAVRKTRIQQSRVNLVLNCALDIFATYGFHGATIDKIAAKANLSKPNVLYYFRNKEHIYQALLERTLKGWLDPLEAVSAEGDPQIELARYIASKVDMSFDNPLASRLFAMEVLNGAPQLKTAMRTILREVVDRKAGIIQAWMEQGRLKPVDPHHLIFSIWSVTQHYADFGVQIEAVLGTTPSRGEAKAAVLDLLLRGLKV